MDKKRLEKKGIEVIDKGKDEDKNGTNCCWGPFAALRG